jgi:thioredoxin-related protein
VELHKELKGKGLNIVAIGLLDDPGKIVQFNRGFKADSTLLVGKGEKEVFSQFGVRAVPTNYILDSDGEVAHRFVGYKQKKLLEALEKLGVK